MNHPVAAVCIFLVAISLVGCDEPTASKSSTHDIDTTSWEDIAEVLLEEGTTEEAAAPIRTWYLDRNGDGKGDNRFVVRNREAKPPIGYADRGSDGYDDEPLSINPEPGYTINWSQSSGATANRTYNMKLRMIGNHTEPMPLRSIRISDEQPGDILDVIRWHNGVEYVNLPDHRILKTDKDGSLLISQPPEYNRGFLGTQRVGEGWHCLRFSYTPDASTLPRDVNRQPVPTNGEVGVYVTIRAFEDSNVLRNPPCARHN